MDTEHLDILKKIALLTDRLDSMIAILEASRFVERINEIERHFKNDLEDLENYVSIRDFAKKANISLSKAYYTLHAGGFKDYKKLPSGFVIHKSEIIKYKKAK